MTRIGIMQGRLLPPCGERIQAFPTRDWAEEFPRAAAVPLDCIEFIYEVQGHSENPLANDVPAARLRELIAQHPVAVRSVCADYFMDRPLVHDPATGLRELSSLLQRCHQLGIERIVLPFVDASRIRSAEDRDIVIGLLKKAEPILDETGVEIHLETDLAPAAFAEFLQMARHPRVRVNYDSGNSASLGYAVGDEFAAYGQRIGSVHIKDRVRGGGTVPLGQGAVDFPSLFAALRAIDYQGDLILQVARGTLGDEIAWARHNRAFVEAQCRAAGYAVPSSNEAS